MTSQSIEVGFVRLDPGVPLPRYAHHGDAGADLAIAEDCELAPGERKVVGTGLALVLPDGWAGFVHPRSGLAARSGLTIVNAPGTIDSGYRGEVKICLLNTDRHTPIRLSRGDLVAQLVVQRVDAVSFVELDALPDSDRGAGGYGSTGGVAQWLGQSTQRTETEVGK
ncbi:dUTP pyrophosphatase [Propionicimonas paludicola]|uniref:Deoxyuridine 5'-triphosphate nucleotidohydrolase n=1 Tax=Propionicimonas paludicola TaxID=185243 RepID=A0A2A9CQA0_9ACTN|nr:dUTP diphosphatase [Propionicimonas paludicola]PFG16604.1 dUTP pyrophosphatase [Propionicimonas paludicola]